MKSPAPTTTSIPVSAPALARAAARWANSRRRRGPDAATVVVVAVVVLCCLVWFVPPGIIIVTASTTSTPTTATASDVNPNNQYESIRQLDKYGNSLQLRFAGEASRQRGRLVVAIALPSGDVVLATTTTASPTTKASPHTGNDNEGEDEVRTTTTTATTAASMTRPLSHRDPPLRFTTWGIQRVHQQQRQRHGKDEEDKDTDKDAEFLLHDAPLMRVWNRRARCSPPTVATVMSGLGADARYVNRHLCEASKDAWDVYGTDISGPAVLHELQALYRSFWGYSDSWSWRASGHSRKDSGDDSEGWARPLGVTTMVIHQPSSSGANVYVVEPSGIIQHATQIVSPTSRTNAVVSVACIGRNSVNVQSRLEKLLREKLAEPQPDDNSNNDNPLTVDDVLTLIARAIHDDDDSSRQLSSRLYAEVLSTSGGIQRRVVPT